jgi:hypothetical protein
MWCWGQERWSHTSASHMSSWHSVWARGQLCLCIHLVWPVLIIFLDLIHYNLRIMIGDYVDILILWYSFYLSFLLSLCLCMLSIIAFVCQKQSLLNSRYVYHGSWAHSNSALQQFPLSPCVSLCISLLSLQCSDSVKCIPSSDARQRLSKDVLAATIHSTVEEFYTLCVSAVCLI